MQASDKDFRPVKPQGREGDKKNDGFNKVKGQYYQVYSPEDTSDKERESYKKLDSTFEELYNYWQLISPIKEFYWVYNDKFQTGVYPSIEKTLAEIEQKFEVKANPFLSKDLEDVFLSLQESEIIEILGGHLPDHNYIEDVIITILGEVINFLVRGHFNLNNITFPNEINFDKKIRFNKLSNVFSTLLKTAFHQDYIITEYFKYNSKFTKENLKTVFSDLYREALERIPDSIPEKADLVFDYILNKARPRNNMAETNAVLTLMAHYFESCDIYEEPVEPKQIPLF
ncbi:MAG: hypothetical protein A2W91_01175 [Bacteroidetes bacterium GWF2_38_335]|nr:MAG: hypothetical protein A2W91_01175 [Bacteroidetes bacterium GWF2_38_335]OFY80364.1 MAG: hypothetical protein A2281_17685 [Bacteroidetes bacterium RIFOXYA12_FULL_38_20]HBS88835.1 hypothetical protein [Bacteroidales bacterium]